MLMGLKAASFYWRLTRCPRDGPSQVKKRRGGGKRGGGRGSLMRGAGVPRLLPTLGDRVRSSLPRPPVPALRPNPHLTPSLHPSSLRSYLPLSPSKYLAAAHSKGPSLPNSKAFWSSLKSRRCEAAIRSDMPDPRARRLSFIRACAERSWRTESLLGGDRPVPG